MNKIISILLVFLLLACTNKKQKEAENSESLIYQAKDQEILEQIFELFAHEEDTPMDLLMVKIGFYFMGVPYVAHTLETESSEKLVVNLRELDCTT